MLGGLERVGRLLIMVRRRRWFCVYDGEKDCWDLDALDKIERDYLEKKKRGEEREAEVKEDVDDGAMYDELLLEAVNNFERNSSSGGGMEVTSRTTPPPTQQATITNYFNTTVPLEVAVEYPKRKEIVTDLVWPKDVIANDLQPEETPIVKEYATTWIYPSNMPEREYQFQMVRSCLVANTLVSLPTGLGKTFIAAVVMYNFWRWFPQAKVGQDVHSHTHIPRES